MHEFPTTIHSVTRVIYEMLKENTTTFINGMFLESTWHLLGIYLTSFWHLPGIYLAYAWHLPDIFLASTWPRQRVHYIRGCLQLCICYDIEPNQGICEFVFHKMIGYRLKTVDVSY